MEAELRRALAARGTVYKDVGAEVLGQLASAAQQQGLPAKAAAAAFDKFITVHRLQTSTLTADDVAAFRADYSRGRPQPLADERASNLFNRVSLDDVVLPDIGAGEDSADASASAAVGPQSQRITPYMNKVVARPTSTIKSYSPSTGGKFAGRQGSGSVVASLNSHLEVPPVAEGDAMELDGAKPTGVPRCTVQVLGQAQGAHAKYMVDRLEDKVAYLERRILRAEAAAEAALGLDVHPVAVAAQRAALFVGRVCCDTEGGRLNAQSLLLEGSQKSSGGARARLDVSHCPAYRLFPGQVVALLGTNPSGHCIVASQLLPGAAAAPLPRTCMAQLADYASATGQAGVSVVAAAGPFTSSEDLEYAPLGALLDYCAAAPPDVLLLVGPFVDEEHPVVRGGTLEQTFHEIYTSRVLGQISRFVSRVGGQTRVLLVPSARDVHHHPVLPQPPLDGSEADTAGATALANPATLRCNEAVVGVSAADWLMACNREEVSVSATPEDRLPALAAHLPAQCSFFPLFPPPLGTPLDCSRAGPLLDMPCTPDLLLLPSDLAPFAKLCAVPQLDGTAAAAARAVLVASADEVQQTCVPEAALPRCTTVCINPGRLTKGASGGTFAHIHILPMPDAVAMTHELPAATNAPVPHQVDRRCRVDIKRI